MGYGSFMNVVNRNDSAITVFVTDSTCMWDNGEEGSNLSLFNNATVPANGSLPASGSQYIEAKNSGSCFFGSSSFTLSLETASATQIGTLAFTDSNASWSCSNTNPDVLNVNINNSAQQGVITITVDTVS